MVTYINEADLMKLGNKKVLNGVGQFCDRQAPMMQKEKQGSFLKVQQHYAPYNNVWLFLYN